MGNSCLVSIIVPVCNVQSFLRQCLNSLTDQTLQDIQIICIDDGSTDASLAILQEYAARDPRIEIISKPNAGYGHTMNCGLAAAKGEYIGIVESDDFAEVDMFEKLYSLAKKHDVDIVKSNYYQYLTDTDPAKGFIVENLAGCIYDEVFCPLDSQSIFLTQPAIWSALYKRDFLLKEDIVFLETPGASFQDTSFNFKVFAAAKKVILTKDAFLHYRIDNANSSVKSLKKVFCICDEYKEIWDFAHSRIGVFESLKYRIPQIQFGGYVWNLERLTPGLQYRFYKKFVEEFWGFKSEGLLEREYFDEVAWEKLQGILADPASYFSEHYGPIDVQRTLLVILEESANRNADRVLSALHEVFNSGDEIYVYSASSSLQSNLSRIVDRFSNMHLAEGQISSVVSEQLNIDLIQGNSCVLLKVGGPEWKATKTPKLIKSVNDILNGVSRAEINESWAVTKWDTEKLKEVNLPIWPSLLFADFYSNDENSSISQIPSWLTPSRCLNDGVNLQDYCSAYQDLKELYSNALASENISCFHLFNSLWLRVSSSFNYLKYDDRLQIRRPSVCDFEPLVIKRSSFDVKPLVTVIIPVYNAEKFLSQCLDSILSQTVAPLELVCINDGSVDASVEILEDYARNNKQITLISQFNGGAGAARNRGIDYAQGEYLAFIDPDDSYSSDTALFDLVNAAKDNDVKISGGSLKLIYPDGSEKKYFGGEQSFYTFRKAGLFSLLDLQSDYGWIRFLYHSSIFEEGKVRFPEYRWYEDPVFLTRVMTYCDSFYAISTPVYDYRVDYKETNWDVVKVRDLLNGIAANLEFAEKNNLPTLYSALVSRLNYDYYSAIMEHLDDAEVLLILLKIQGNLNIKMINAVNENNLASYLIRPLSEFDIYGTAVVRLARRVEKTGFYKRLQDVRLKARQS